MNTTHTPGPWTFSKQPIDPLQLSSCLHNGFCVSAPGHVVAQVNDEENARLIAAAPELLTMLRRVMDEYLMRDPANGPICQLTLEQARAAIAKAEGNA